MDTGKILAGMGITTSGAVPGEAVRPGTITKPLSERITGKVIGYEQIIDILLLSPPGETQGQLAARIGYSQSWLSRMISSDSFQARLAERIEKDIEPERREAFKLRFSTIEEEARGVLLTSLQKLSDRLSSPIGVPDELLVKSATMASKMLGYGARKEQTAPAVNLHVHLENLANNLRNLSKSTSVAGVQSPVIEGEIVSK